MSNLTIWWQTNNLEFIGKYARLDDDDHIFSDENANDEASDGFGNFIDDLYVEQSVCGYLPIENITKPKEGATHDDINCGISNEESDPENYLPECFNEQKIQYDESKNFHKRMENFKNDFDIYVKYSTDSFHFAILYGTRLELTGKRDFVTDQEILKNDISTELFVELYLLKNGLILNSVISNFEQQYLDVNKLLMTEKLFLRVYELRKKLRYLIHKSTEKN